MHKTADTTTRLEPGARRALALGLALGVAVCYFVLMFATAQGAGLAAYREERNLALIEEMVAAREPGDLTVVAIGNSRLRYGLRHGVYPSADVRLPDGRRVRILQFAEDVAQFDNYKNLWPAIMAAKPDLIVMVDMLFSTARRAERVSLKNMSALTFDFMRRGLTGRSFEDEWQHGRTNITDTCLTEVKVVHVQDRLTFTAHRDRHRLENNANTDHARAALRQALMAGRRVALLRFPSYEPWYAPYGVERHLVDYYGLGFVPTPAQIAPDSVDEFMWWEYPMPGAESYCDFVHFTPRGAEDFTAWFMRMLGDAL